MRARIAFTLVTALFAVAPALAADPKKDDKKEEGKDAASLMYASWAKHKPGTSVTLVMTAKASGDGNAPSTSEHTGTIKLLEVTDDKCVIEAQETTKSTWQKEEKLPATKADVGKKFDGTLSAGFFEIKIDPKTGQPSEANGKIVEEKTEKVKVGKTDFECKRYKFKKEAEGRSFLGGSWASETTVWLCDSFPGRVVKATIQASVTEKNDLSMTYTATDFTPGK